MCELYCFGGKLTLSQQVILSVHWWMGLAMLCWRLASVFSHSGKHSIVFLWECWTHKPNGKTGLMLTLYITGRIHCASIFFLKCCLSDSISHESQAYLDFLIVLAVFFWSFMCLKFPEICLLHLLHLNSYCPIIHCTLLQF